MRKVFSANFAKVAVIAVALAVAATCTVAGTLAAFSATYTWNAETATGSAYSDTDYSLDLFGGRTIMPGDSGSAVLGGPDFGDSVVEWSLSVGGVGDKSVPVVFYVKDAEGNLYQDFYSPYAFSEGLSASWIDCEGKGISLGSVRDNPISIASRLGVGCTLCWVWPKAFYTSDALEEELADEQTEEYSNYCASVMSAEYGFTAAHANTLDAVDAQAFVVSTDGDVLNAVSGAVSDCCSVQDGLFVMHGRTVNAEQSGNFFVPDHAFELSADSAVWVLVPENPETTPAASTEKTLQENGISFEKGDLYEFSVYNFPESGTVDITATPNAEGNRRLYRIFPSASGGMSAKISVTVTAVVGW